MTDLCASRRINWRTRESLCPNQKQVKTVKEQQLKTTGIDKEDKIKLGMGEVGIKNNGGMYRNICVDI